MLQSIMTSRGQVTIPAEIRDRLGLTSGNKIEFLIRDSHIIMLPINKTVKNLKGILPKPDIVLSIDDMKEIIQNIK
ncbi:MAG: AbrB/MazE/SpoVT family DNA-binding domain-containing protein [Rickettsiaceae bacterium]|nr:AbrB/MazE/SpoVT family DNA-binding domain-containing protein [Rickettsiaceae bacterium]